MSTSIDPRAAASILHDIREHERLSKLSDLDLIKECLGVLELDHPIVEVMMDRIRPNWIDEV